MGEYIMNVKPILSIVIPCYNSTDTLEQVVQEIVATMSKQDLKYEIILVDDGSPNGTTYPKICELAQKNRFVKGIQLSRNFGQPNAVMAGINNAIGDYIVCGDDDGETPFGEIPRMLEKIYEGFDVVEAKYVQKDERGIRRKIGTKLNEIMQTVFINKPADLSLTTFWIIKKYVAVEMCKYRNAHPYIGGLIIRNTNNICNIEVTRRKRISGTSGYSLKKMMELWLNGFTTFSTKPLRMTSYLGCLLGGVGFLVAIVTVVRKIINPNVMAGYTSLMAVILFLFGVLFFVLGVFGEYIGQTYLALNNTPQFVVKDTVNFDE